MSFLVHYDPTADRPEWRHVVYSSTPLAIIYRLSCFGYSIVGALLIIYAEPLSHCDAGFWWSVLGAALLLQGVASYMNDVVSWGRPSVWKSIDPKMASTLFLLAGPLLGVRSAMGLFSTPSSSSTIRIWLTGCAFSFLCKCMGARASWRGRGGGLDSSCEELMGWHVGWHGLPVFAVFCILDLAYGFTWTLPVVEA